MTIDLNIDDLIQEFNFPKNTADFIVSDTVERITDEIFRNWQLQATNALKSTRNEYINNLQIIDNSAFSKTIILTGKLPNMLESGISAFDMKEGFRKSAKVKYSYKTDKNGNVTAHWYLTIPFRIGTPGIVGENSAFSNIMPQEVYNVMKGRMSDSGLKKSEIPFPHNIPSSRREIILPSRVIPEYKHKSSIYQGMVKKTAAYGNTTQNTYMTFRRVSENSDPNSWIHKGIQAYNLMKKAVQETDVSTLAENNVDIILSNLGYGK
jgi:hypothetical protein